MAESLRDYDSLFQRMANGEVPAPQPQPKPDLYQTRLNQLDDSSSGKTIDPVDMQQADLLAAHDGSEFLKGLRRAGYNALGETQAMLGNLLENVAPETGRSLQNAGVATLRNMPASMAPAVRSMQDIDGIGSALSYTAGQLGEQLPNTASWLLGAGIGGGVGAAAKFAAGARGLRELAPAIGTGAAIGGRASVFPMEAGEAALNLAADPEAMQRTTPLERTGIMAAKGGINTALETLVPEHLVLPRLLGNAAKIERGLRPALRNVGLLTGEGILGEGATEAAQEVVGQAGQMLANPSAQFNPQQILEAGTVGGLIGGVMGGGAGTLQGITTNLPRLGSKPQAQGPGAVSEEELPAIHKNFSEAVAKIGDPMVREALQAHVDSIGSLSREDISLLRSSIEDETGEKMVDPFARSNRANVSAADLTTFKNELKVGSSDLFKTISAYINDQEKKSGDSEAGGTLWQAFRHAAIDPAWGREYFAPIMAEDFAKDTGQDLGEVVGELGKTKHEGRNPIERFLADSGLSTTHAKGVENIARAPSIEHLSPVQWQGLHSMAKRAGVDPQNMFDTIKGLDRDKSKDEDHALVSEYNHQMDLYNQEAGPDQQRERLRLYEGKPRNPLQRKAVDALTHVLGLKALYVEHENGRSELGLDGSIVPGHPDTIIVANNSSKALTRVAMHEVVHGLQRMAPEIYNNLATSLRTMYDEGAVQSHLTGRGYDKDLSKSHNEEEFVADLTSDILHSPSGLLRVAGYMDQSKLGYGRAFLHGAADALDRINTKMSESGFKSEAGLVKEKIKPAREAIAKAMAEYVRANKATTASRTAPASNRMAEAEQWMTGALEPGAMSYGELSERGQSQGFTPQEMEGARRRLGATISPEGVALPGRMDRISMWIENTLRNQDMGANELGERGRMQGYRPDEINVAFKNMGGNIRPDENGFGYIASLPREPGMAYKPETPKGRMRDAETFVAETLQNGPMDTHELTERGARAGFNSQEVHAAHKNLYGSISPREGGGYQAALPSAEDMAAVKQPNRIFAVQNWIAKTIAQDGAMDVSEMMERGRLAGFTDSEVNVGLRDMGGTVTRSPNGFGYIADVPLSKRVSTQPEKIKAAAKFINAFLKKSNTASLRDIAIAAKEQGITRGELSAAIEEKGIHMPNTQAIPDSLLPVNGILQARQVASVQRWKNYRRFKSILDARITAAADSAGVDLTSQDSHTQQYLVKAFVQEAREAQRNNANAIGWYSRILNESMDITTMMHPELEDNPRMKFAFTWALAATSNGIEVGRNYRLAEEAFDYYKQHGEMPTDIGEGQAAEAIDEAMNKFNTMSKSMGMDAFMKLMTTKMTAGEVTKKTGISVDEPVDTEVYGSIIIGPKIGNGFFSNLYGHYEMLTLDRWMMRSWGRQTGTLVTAKNDAATKKAGELREMIRALSPQQRADLGKILGSPIKLGDIRSINGVFDLAYNIKKATAKPDKRADISSLGEGGNDIRKRAISLVANLDGQNEAPKNGSQRTFIRKVFTGVLDELKKDTAWGSLTMSDLQALLWYPEKLLYDQTGVAKPKKGEVGYENDEAPDYANAARNLALARGYSLGQIQAARRAGDVRRGALQPENVSPTESTTQGELVPPSRRESDQFHGGLSIQQSADLQGKDFVPSDREQATVIGSLLDALYKGVGRILSVKVESTEGRYGGIERAFDLMFRVAKGTHAADIWRTMVGIAKENAQDSTFLSRTLNDDEAIDYLTHRPGIEIYFKEAQDKEHFDGMIQNLAQKGVEFFTVVTDGRNSEAHAPGEMPPAIGVRMQWIPEFEQRYGMDNYADLSDDELAQRVVDKGREFDDLARDVADQIEGVRFAAKRWYETRVAFSSQYEEVENGIQDQPTGRTEAVSSQTGEQRGWSGQRIREGIEAANRHVRATEAGNGSVSSGNGEGKVALPDEGIVASIRTKPDPKKTVIAYKLFRVMPSRPGELFPLFVKMGGGTAQRQASIPIGTWQDAEIGEAAKPSKTGIERVKGLGFGLSKRPGFHAGDLPRATHIGGKNEEGDVSFRKENHVWAEVEMADDVDWQAEADRRATPFLTGHRKGEMDPSTAEIKDQIPTDGFYRYKTNANMEGKWLIGGAMKINRVLSDEEVSAINAAHGTADKPREKPFDAKKYGFEFPASTGNSGAFDAANPDIVASHRTVNGAPIMPTWAAPEPTPLDTFIYNAQDKLIDLKRIQEVIGQVEDLRNGYQKELLYHERSAKRLEDFLNHEVRPLAKEMQNEGLTLDELERYLILNHVEERNRENARINPGLKGPGSGIETTDAISELSKIPQEQRAKLDRIAGMVMAIIHDTQDLLVSEGLEPSAMIDAWRDVFPNYVPFMREEADSIGMGTGSGFSVKGPSTKRAMGSDKPIVNVLANIFMMRERTIIRAEKNRVSKALMGLAIEHPNPDFWLPVIPGAKGAHKKTKAILKDVYGLSEADFDNLFQDPPTRFINEKGQVEFRINPALRNRDNVLGVRVNGKDQFLFFNDKDPRAYRLVRALKNVDAPELGTVLGGVKMVTQYFAAVNTQWNPIFGATNLARDLGFAMINLGSTTLAGHRREVLAKVWPAMQGIYQDLRAERAGDSLPKNEWSELWELFQAVGGKTGYKQMYKDSNDRSLAFERMLDPSAWASTPMGQIFTASGKLKVPMEAARKRVEPIVGPIFGWLEDYNETLENSIRLSAFKTAMDQGMSQEQAAVLAKNLTVNFNKKGALAGQIGALYAFYNASAQGTARLLESLNGPEGKYIIAGGLMVGAIQATLLAAAGFEPDEPAEFVKEKNLLLPLPGGGKNFLSWPLPLGFNVIPNTGRILGEMVFSGGKDIIPKTIDILGSYLSTFDPLGGGSSISDIMSPTVTDPIVALERNSDAFGRPIAREDLSKLDPTPGFTRAKDTASVFSRGLSKTLNYMSGGTDYTPGAVSPTPDQIDYLVGQLTGGVGREVLKTSQLIENIGSDEELPPHKVPLVGRFYGSVSSESAEKERYYANITLINKADRMIKGLREDGLTEDADKYISKHPHIEEQIKAGEATQREINKTKREIKKAVSPDRKDELTKKNAELISRFNEFMRQ